MNNNTILKRFSVSPECFKDRYLDPIKTDDGFIYDLEERIDKKVCPYCSSPNVYIKGYYQTMINISTDSNITDTLRIKRVRYKCNDCSKTFTNCIEGIEKYNKISEFTKTQILNDFFLPLSFQQIADKYHISSAYVIDLFDTNMKSIPIGNLPEVLCIDEIRFSSGYDQKYVCVLVDYRKRTVYDIVQSRQLSYLTEYFSKFSQNELNRVKYFISDMYDGYSTVKNRFFPKAVHVIDLFHIVTQLTRIVNVLRTRTMNRQTHKGSLEYNFMKAHWKYFLRRTKDIADRFYTHKASGELIHYDDAVFKCIKKDEDLWTAYNTLQDLYTYSKNKTYTESEAFIKWIYERLMKSKCEDLIKVGQTYYKWRVGISNAFAKNQTGLNLTNAIAECLNNQIKTLIKNAYGYTNFTRFRKRALLILKYAKMT